MMAYCESKYALPLVVSRDRIWSLLGGLLFLNFMLSAGCSRSTWRHLVSVVFLGILKMGGLVLWVMHSWSLLSLLLSTEDLGKVKDGEITSSSDLIHI